MLLGSARDEMVPLRPSVLWATMPMPSSGVRARISASMSRFHSLTGVRPPASPRLYTTLISGPEDPACGPGTGGRRSVGSPGGRVGTRT